MEFLLPKKSRIPLFLIFLASLPCLFTLATPPNPPNENQLLRIIDEEFLALSEDPETLEWTEDYGLQPIDGYELDYSEKCSLIQISKNKKALEACVLILGMTN